VHALLLSDDPHVRGEQLAQIETRSAAALRLETLRMVTLVQGIARRERFALVALLGPGLRGLSSAQRAVFIRVVQAVIDADQAVSIFEYVVAQTLRTRLDDRRHPRERARVKHRSLAAVSAELQLLLSLLAHAGDFDGTEASGAFAAGAARLQRIELTLLPPSQRLLSGLGTALEQLVALAPRLSEQVIDACAHTVLADGRVADDEETLLRAVCDALGSPLPPLDPATMAFAQRTVSS
jgi:tellurite resistance protein